MVSALVAIALPWFAPVGLPPVGSWDYRDLPNPPVVIERKRTNYEPVVYPETVPSDVYVPPKTVVQPIVISVDEPVRRLQYMPIPDFDIGPDDIIRPRRARERAEHQEETRLLNRYTWPKLGL